MQIRGVPELEGQVLIQPFRHSILQEEDGLRDFKECLIIFSRSRQYVLLLTRYELREKKQSWKIVQSDNSSQVADVGIQ